MESESSGRFRRLDQRSRPSLDSKKRPPISTMQRVQWSGFALVGTDPTGDPRSGVCRPHQRSIIDEDGCKGILLALLEKIRAGTGGSRDRAPRKHFEPKSFPKPEKSGWKRTFRLGRNPREARQSLCRSREVRPTSRATALGDGAPPSFQF